MDVSAGLSKASQEQVLVCGSVVSKVQVEGTGKHGEARVAGNNCLMCSPNTVRVSKKR